MTATRTINGRLSEKGCCKNEEPWGSSFCVQGSPTLADGEATACCSDDPEKACSQKHKA